MDFLREAVQRNRRILQLRDLLLLALRTLCVLLFGLAMARPYFSNAAGAVDPDQPVHAVLMVDNSLSMAYAKLDGTLLDEARAKAGEFIAAAAAGEPHHRAAAVRIGRRIQSGPLPHQGRRPRALRRIEMVDRGGTRCPGGRPGLAGLPASPRRAGQAGRLHRATSRRSTGPSESLASAIRSQLPEMQVVQIARPETENAWIADSSCKTAWPMWNDGDVPGHGPLRRRRAAPDVQVTLTVDGSAAASKTIDLEPGQTAEVSFPYRFEVAPEPGQAKLCRGRSFAPRRSPAGRTTAAR